mmetsp:Transcript_18611/g.52567  ORF Transcript_18611/g.52567 Transcript_18611/m.52567 type:complete len:227 (-) Transcript_18611:558-1238(-)
MDAWLLLRVPCFRRRDYIACRLPCGTCRLPGAELLLLMLLLLLRLLLGSNTVGAGCLLCRPWPSAAFDRWHPGGIGNLVGGDRCKLGSRSRPCKGHLDACGSQHQEAIGAERQVTLTVGLGDLEPVVSLINSSHGRAPQSYGIRALVPVFHILAASVGQTRCQCTVPLIVDVVLLENGLDERWPRWFLRPFGPWKLEMRRPSVRCRTLCGLLLLFQVNDHALNLAS